MARMFSRQAEATQQNKTHDPWGTSSRGFFERPTWALHDPRGTWSWQKPAMQQAWSPARAFPAPTMMPIQRKATVSVPSDPLEKAADEGAEKLLRMEEPAFENGASGTIQRKCASCEDEDDNKIHAKREGGTSAAMDTSSAIAAAQRPGVPLPRQTRAFFEPRMGTDLSGVRIHTDAEAARAAAGVQAKAYTWRDKIVFGAGEYAPETDSGKRLLAHELMHWRQKQDSSIRSGCEEPIAREPTAEATAEEESLAEAPETDPWKGSLVSDVLISLARNRVGFHVPQGMLLGKVSTDLKVGKYTLKPLMSEQKWIISGEGVKPGTRFTVDLTESNADPWTLSYPEELPLIVTPGLSYEPKIAREFIFDDPLAVYEGWGNLGPSKPVAGIDDFEQILVVPGNPYRYKVMYRDRTERLLVHTELTPKMLAYLRYYFTQVDTETLLFILETFPVWWNLIRPPLAPMPQSGANPYISKRVPLAPPELESVPLGQGAKAGPARVALQPPAAGRPAEPLGPASPNRAPSESANESPTANLGKQANAPAPNVLMERQNQVMNEILTEPFEKSNLGREIFRDVRDRLAQSKDLSPVQKVEVFNKARIQINKVDASWSARQGQSPDAAGVWTGEARPFAVAIDKFGRVWQTMDFHEASTYVQGEGFRIDFTNPKWTEIK